MGEKGGLVVMVASPLKTRFDVEFGVYYVKVYHALYSQGLDPRSMYVQGVDRYLGLKRGQ